MISLDRTATSERRRIPRAPDADKMALPAVVFVLQSVAIGFMVFVAVSVQASPAGGCPEEAEDSLEATAAWIPRTPEQTLYAYVRCLNDSSASIEMKIRWVMWQPDQSPESQCYVKCVSESLRLYDPVRRQFDPERFVLQARTFHDDPNSPEMHQMYRDARELLAGELPDSECSSVFAKYAPFYAVHQEHILDIFHGDLRKILVTYKRLAGHVKQIGQSFIEYCEQRYGFSWGEQETRLCPKRTAIDCVLRGFRWITEEGAVDMSEIERDYTRAGQAMEELASKCTSNDQLYHCLRAIDATALAKVIRERNAATAFYFDHASEDEPWKSAVLFGNSRLNRSS
ncbi:37 kDa salivary gland allergen Aed a 2-like [Anopheles darlingi]|uniref:37 kDa salivary gland allergen Aed a 2-like n=1 Tax=Anopheles darlingi TaxID=43151 RepID=UPI00210023DE|nr:37 kDa salivary gland allergen Aed a 2-like [Anopheles darlingi]